MNTVGGLFFPQRRTLGLDQRELTPSLVAYLTWATAESRSAKKAAKLIQKLGGPTISAATISRVAREVGSELAELRDESPSRLSRVLVPASPEEPPGLAVVQCDGGRMLTRKPGQGRGVHDQAWRETKNACLLRMSHENFDEDPHPDLPASLANSQQMAKLAEVAAPDETEPTEDESLEKASVEQPTSPEELLDPSSAGSVESTWPPKPLVRTCLSSLVKASAFGLQMSREALHRRFDEAPLRAFLGDGLRWNWKIWKRYFRNYTPILDFLHVASYLFKAARALHAEEPSKAWATYHRWAEACWQSKVRQVITELRQRLLALGLRVDCQLGESHPHRPLIDAQRYLSNNRQRMDYVSYRKQGLPVTTALMESLVKEINQRVKGTEMFWDDGVGGEAILQIRSAALCEDDRLDHYLARRPGYEFVRRSTPRTAA